MIEVEHLTFPGGCDHLGCTQSFVGPMGERLAVKEFGDSGDPTIMLIHGFSQNHLTWTNQFEDLVNQGFHVVAWDYLGHGDSDRPTKVKFYDNAKVWGDYVQAVIDDLGIDETCIVAHSLGGQVVDDYIFNRGTENVAGIVYAGGLHIFDVGSPPPHLSSEMLALAPILIDQELSVRLQATKDFNSILTNKMLDDEVVRDINMYNMQVSREAIAGLLDYINETEPRPSGYDADVLGKLASIPTLFIHGDKDQIVPFEVAPGSVSLIQNAGGTDVELVTLKRIGHSPHFESTNKFNNEVAEFCGRVLN